MGLMALLEALMMMTMKKGYHPNLGEGGNEEQSCHMILWKYHLVIFIL